MNRAACTIVSLNYLPYARTLCDSFLALHPECKFYVLVVDRLPVGYDASSEHFEVVLVEDLDIPSFASVAFKYDILELNTNVKPTFLKSLLRRGVDQLIYFDPDILIYESLAPIFEAGMTSAVVLTPHALSPMKDDLRSEAQLLTAGVFNLGFVAVSKGEESEAFLNWWEERCLNLAYDEPRSGLFVDQKWLNLAPCYFRSVHILKHLGCNVAYWNLHERRIEKKAGIWKVNETDPLLFYHFSGINIDGGDRISKYCDSFDLTNCPHLRPLFADYRERLVSNGIREIERWRYAFGYFTNGVLINKLTRAAYAAKLDTFLSTDPFQASGPYYRWAKRTGLLSRHDSVRAYTCKSYNGRDVRIRVINAILRACLRLVGGDRYAILMKYLSFVSILRNQRDVLTAP